MIYDEKSGQTLVLEKVVTVKKNSIALALNKIYELMKEVESVSDECEDWEVKNAASKFHEALGATNNMVMLGLLEPGEFYLISRRQKIVGERLTKLHEKRTLGTANTESPKVNNL